MQSPTPPNYIHGHMNAEMMSKVLISCWILSDINSNGYRRKYDEWPTSHKYSFTLSPCNAKSN